MILKRKQHINSILYENKHGLKTGNRIYCRADSGLSTKKDYPLRAIFFYSILAGSINNKEIIPLIENF